ncbi:MAG: nucleotidyltransferase domain-containing protein [Cyclobacteriaceae bacterium]|nr:nucleotidyltransferase domain-containing protein [Cyclobacteriaceae bacterium]
MNKILTNHLPTIAALCKEHNIKSLFAFGSVVNDSFTDASDIDLLVSFFPMDYSDYADNYFEVAEKLERIFDRPIDLITDKSLHNPYFIDSVNKSKILLYG